MPEDVNDPDDYSMANARNTSRAIPVNFGDWEDYEKYERDCNIFYNIMDLVLGCAAQTKIDQLTDPYNIMERLRSVYCSNKFARMLKLTLELCSTPFEEGGDIVKYLDDKSIAAQ
jgi:hypothetical protein